MKECRIEFLNPFAYGDDIHWEYVIRGEATPIRYPELIKVGQYVRGNVRVHIYREGETSFPIPDDTIAFVLNYAFSLSAYEVKRND